MVTSSSPRGNRGFTLVEIMVTAVVIGLIASQAPRALIEVERFFLMNRARVEMQRDARDAMTVITRNLRSARKNTIVIDSPTIAGVPQPYCSRISFTKKVDDVGAGINQAGTPIVYFQDGRKLVMLTSGGRRRVLSSNLQFLSFAAPRSSDLGLVTVSMTFSKSTFEGKHKALHMSTEKVRIMNP